MALPPEIRAAIIARIVALTPTTTGPSAYAGASALADTTAWAECQIPLTPMNLPDILLPLRVWVELGDAADLNSRPDDTTEVNQEVSCLWLYPLRNMSEPEKADFERAWYSMSHLYLHIMGGDWAETNGNDFTVDRAPRSMMRPVRVGEAGHLLCEIRFTVQYPLEA